MWRLLKLYFKDNEFYGKKDIRDICKVYEGIADSDFMPFINNVYYVPKPAMITEGLLDLNIKDFKFHRVLKYIEISDLPDFFAGGFDFEKKSSLSFGRYTCSEGFMKYEFADGVGIYAVILSDEPDDEIIIKARAKIELMGDACAIDRAEIDRIPESVGEGDHDQFWMLLGSLNTMQYSEQQLNELLKDSFYQVGHKKDKPGLFILPGACFKEKFEWLEEKAVLLELFL